MRQKFEVTLSSTGPKGAWISIAIPFNVQKVFGSKSRVPVKGTINGFGFRSSLYPEGDGTHYMVVNKTLQAGAKVKAGDHVHMELELDTAERTVTIPKELEQALTRDTQARDTFMAFSYSHRKEFTEWIASAKKPETRVARAAKALEMLRAKKPLG